MKEKNDGKWDRKGQLTLGVRGTRPREILPKNGKNV